MILLAGLVFLLAGGVGVWQDRRLTRTGQRVTGTVTDLRVRLTDNDGGRTRVYRAVIAFRTLDGQDVQTENRVSSSRITVGPGQPVPVLYDPRRPRRAVIDTRAGRVTWLPFVIVVAGLALTGYAVYRLISGRS